MMAKKQAGSEEMDLDGGEAVRINLNDPEVVKYLDGRLRALEGP